MEEEKAPPSPTAAAAAAEEGTNIPKPTTLRKEPSFSRWCGDDDDERISPTTEPPDLPLLKSESDSPRSNSFRQRNHLPHFVVNGNGKSSCYIPLDIENGGIHTSDSVTKLESLEQASQKNAFSVGLVLKTLFFVLVWYFFSTVLTLYNKELLGDHMGHFPAPLLMNTVHFSMQAILSNLIICFQSRCYNDKSTSSSDHVTMTWKDYFIRVVPTALGTALDINLSNASLVFISVTFATMCKSASPIFLLVFAFAFRLESPSLKLLGIMLVISIGVLLTVAKETQFEFWGFLFVMLAAVMSGFRWSMTQILLQKEAYGLRNPISLMSYVTPVMAVATAVLSLIMDPWSTLHENKYFDNSRHIMQSFLLLLIGGALAFFMVLTEYILVSTTSAVTVTIAGIVKEAVTIVVAVFYFHDPFTLLKGIGLLIIISGVSLFNLYKYQKLCKGHSTDNVEMNSTNGAAKYVILDDMDNQDNNT